MKLSKNDGLLCPNKVITTVDEVVCNDESVTMPEIALKILDQTVEYCCAKFCSDKEFPSDIENIIVSRLYHYAV